MSFGAWLDARDGGALRREWRSLQPRKQVFGEKLPQSVKIATEGIVLLAAQFLGRPAETLEWLCSWVDQAGWPAATFSRERVAQECFLDGALDLEGERIETWTVHEVNEGARGLHHHQVLYSFDMRDDRGSSATVLRLFDRETASAISIQSSSDTMWMIGEPFDLSALLFGYRASFSLPWKGYDLDSMRGLLARVAADLDAHFDTCATWPGGLVDEKYREGNLYNAPARTRIFCYENAGYALEIVESEVDYTTGKHHSLRGTVQGLPWGYEVSIDMRNGERGVEGWLDFTLPRTQFDAMLARLVAVPEISADTTPGLPL